MSPLIKVCGMTEAENIRNVELQGVDMIGFIFYPKSPRCLCQMPGYIRLTTMNLKRNDENVPVAKNQ